MVDGRKSPQFLVYINQVVDAVKINRLGRRPSVNRSQNVTVMQLADIRKSEFQFYAGSSPAGDTIFPR